MTTAPNEPPPEGSSGPQGASEAATAAQGVQAATDAAEGRTAAPALTDRDRAEFYEAALARMRDRAEVAAVHADRAQARLLALLGEAVDWIHEGELRDRIVAALDGREVVDPEKQQLREQVARVHAIPRLPHHSQQTGELGRAYTRGWESVINAIDTAVDRPQAQQAEAELATLRRENSQLLEDQAACIRLEAELTQERESGRRLMAQRQEMAAERYVWQERGDRAEERLRLAHEARRAKIAQLDEIKRAMLDVGLMDEADPYSHADLADVIRQAAAGDRERAEQAEAATARVHAYLISLCAEPHPSHDHVCPDDVRRDILTALDQQES